jgi:prepilin-type N-terminal cleavage/methylation domain-containing protein
MKIHSRGFTLIELLVVVAIILVLMSLLMATLGIARQNRLVVLAHKQVGDIAAALNQYYDQLNCYPPDTGDFGTGAVKETTNDPASLVKYLGLPLQDQLSKKQYGPFLDIPVAQVKAGVYMDPWGHPYQLDAVHILCTDTDQGTFQRVGEPYLPGTPEKEVRDFKVWSAGPDGQDLLGSKANGSRTGVDADNVTSWDD